jgi:hypothetical protein
MGEVKLVGEDVGGVCVRVVHGSELRGEITGILYFLAGRMGDGLVPRAEMVTVKGRKSLQRLRFCRGGFMRAFAHGTDGNGITTNFSFVKSNSF